MMRSLTSTLLLASLLLPGLASAQTGVSDDRVSLPEGPGSLEGVGENVEIDPNMGSMTYNIPIMAPAGFAAVTPSLALGYNSSGGNSVLGMGWDMAVPTIERMTSRGLPEYDSDDMFAANGSDQLVRIDEGEPAVYRSRFEKGFVRYTWHSRQTGEAGYWLAENPDGTRSYFGADAQGNLVDSARVGDPLLGTFRYHLVETVDVYGHRARYDYIKSSGTALLARVGYVFDDQDTPRFEILFDYEGRPDIISDGKPGFELKIDRRLATVEVHSSGAAIRRYELTYEDDGDAGGFSRLIQAERFGQRGERHPVVLGFGYSSAVGGVCNDQQDCTPPMLVDMGQLGINLQSGNATLIDINGDALPDILDTSLPGAHRFFLNQWDGPDEHRFGDPYLSAEGNQTNHNLSAGNVQVIDIDGDGYTDLLNSRTAAVMPNLGQGDWLPQYDLFSSGLDGLDMANDLGEDGDLDTIRFLDYDGDKLIDIIKSLGTGETNITTIYRNTGLGGFVLDEDTESLELGFESDRLQMADINGDGMLDPVHIQIGSMRYRLNLGHGRWGEWVTVGGLPYDQGNITFVEIEDMNNDAVSDIVVVLGNEIRYALGRNDGQFDEVVTLDAEDLGVNFPERFNTTTVLYADMNANGSTDIVWISEVGQVTYLDLFPVRPHLLSLITNGLGSTTEVTYKTAVEEAAAARLNGEPWQSFPTFPMISVARQDAYDELNGVHEIIDYNYRNGFYDGVEKQFRGFERVELWSEGDDTSESSLQTLLFDLGQEDPYRAGLRISDTLKSDERPISETSAFFEDCPLDGLPPVDQLDFPVRHVCQTRTTVLVQEGADPSEWITTVETSAYDGYGNVTLSINEGVTARGGGACGACPDLEDGLVSGHCGPQCLGDERFTETDFIEPGGVGERWILGRMWRERTRTREGGPATERLTFYDGEAFEGLPEGQMTLGDVSRVMVKIDGETWLPESRMRRDEHGNEVEMLRPTGDPEVADDRRSRFTYSDSGLNLIGVETFLKTPEGEPYSLRREYSYDDLWNKVNATSNWLAVRDGQSITPRTDSRVEYDQHGRVVERYLAGAQEPTEVITYELGSPTSRAIFHKRTEIDGDLDQQEVRCFDGFGRLYQSRSQVAEGDWVVSDFQIRNKNGQPIRRYATYTGTTGQCDAEPPQDVPFRSFFYDAPGRQLVETWHSADGNRVRVTEYTPLGEVLSDESDLEAGGPYEDTPVRKFSDGLGRLTHMERLTSLAEGLTTRFVFDEVGNYAGTIDPEGNFKHQVRDLAGRVIEVDDPDRGLIQLELDDEGNTIRKTDARGVTVASVFDGLSRLQTTFDEADPEGTRINYRYDFPEACPTEICTFPARQLVEVDYPLGEDERGSQWLGYGPRQEKLAEVRHLRGRRFEFTWVYDNIMRTVRRTYPGELAVDLVWDGNGRLVSIPGMIDAVTYTDRSKIDVIQMANGTTTERTYDDDQRVTSLVVRDSDDRAVLDHAYTYDLMDQITEVDDRTDLDSGAPSHSARYAYDALGRLTQAHLDPDRAFEEVMDYTYDDLENLIAKTSSLGAASPAHVGQMRYEGAAPHAVTQAGDLALAYDASGYMIRRGERTLDWDHLGRLRAMRGEDGQAISRVYYDQDINRVIEEKTDSTGWFVTPEFEIRKGVASLHIEAGNMPVARVESLKLATTVLSDLNEDARINVADAMLASGVERGDIVIEGEDFSPSGELLTASVEALLAEEGRTVYTHADHLNTRLLTTDDEGQVSERALFYPFGMARGATGDERRGFNGKEFDADTDLTYFGARYLDPWLGRWVSPDPAFEILDDPGFEHLTDATGAYAFVGNNPIKYHDEDGYFIVIASIIIVAAIVVTAVVTIGLLNRFFKKIKQPQSYSLSSAPVGGNDINGRNLGGDKVSSVVAPPRSPVVKDSGLGGDKGSPIVKERRRSSTLINPIETDDGSNIGEPGNEPQGELDIELPNIGGEGQSQEGVRPRQSSRSVRRQAFNELNSGEGLGGRGGRRSVISRSKGKLKRRGKPSRRLSLPGKGGKGSQR